MSVQFWLWSDVPSWSVSLVLWEVFVDFTKENNDLDIKVAQNIAVIVLENFLTFLNFSWKYERKHSIPKDTLLWVQISTAILKTSYADFFLPWQRQR